MTDSTLNVILNFIKKGKGATDVSKELDKLKGKEKEASAQAKLLFNAQKALTAGVGVLGAAFLKNIPALVEQGFQLRNSRIALEAYAGSAAEATDITNAVSEAAGFSVDQFTATLNATRLLSLGLADTAEEAGNVTKTAITLGATMGKNATEAFEQFTLLLANQSILRLDTFGISAGKTRVRMAELAAEFPEMTRDVRFTDAALQIAAEKMALLEAAGFQATSSLDRFNARLADGKLAVSTFLADGLLPIIDGFFALQDARKDLAKRTAEGIVTEEEFENILQNQTLTGRLALEELLNQAEAQQELAQETDAAAQALADFENEEDDLIVTTQILNDAITEEASLASALAAGLSGSISDATKKYGDAVDEAADGVVNARQEIAELGIQLGEGTITNDQYADAVGRVEAGQRKLENAAGDAKLSFEELTKELIFSQAAADLDAETSLLLARSLGLIDEASFATAQEAQKLRAAFELGDITAEEFAEQTRILAGDIIALEGKDVEINAETLEANRSVDAYKAQLATIPRNVSSFVFLSANVQGIIDQIRSGIGGFGLQEGGQFRVPDSGPLGDRFPFNAMLERGETVTVTPRDGSPPPALGGGGGIHIENVNLGSEVSLAMFEQMLERAQ